MPPPKKTSRPLVFRDVNYRWDMFVNRDTRLNELVVESVEAVRGQKLLVHLPRIVNNAWVPQAIDFALKNGWNPQVENEPFVCRYRQGQFLVEEVRGDA